MKFVLTLLALSSFVFAQTKTVSPSGAGLDPITNPAFLTSLGATTTGQNILTLANPSAIRFLRINADNTVSALSDVDFKTAIGAGGTALTDSASLAATISDETGTGSVVFGTNPTLTTPIINVTSDATGDIYYRNAGGLFTRLPIGSNDSILKVTAGVPAWGSVSTGTAKPVISDFNIGWVNQGGLRTATDTSNGLMIYGPNSGSTSDNVGLLLRTLSSNSTWVYKARLRFNQMTGGGNYAHSGLVLYESSSGKFIEFAMQYSTAGLPRIIRLKLNSTTSFNSELPTIAYVNNYADLGEPADGWWFRLVNDATNIVFSVSRDGFVWAQVSSQPKTEFITPDRIGLALQNFTADCSMLCLEWAGP